MKKLLLLLLSLLLATPALALEMKDFGQLPVLDAGRVKPLDSFARHTLHQLSGRDDGAIEWLAATIFSPENAATAPVFRVTGEPLKSLLGLAGRPEKLFSLADLAPGLMRTATEAEAFSRKDVLSAEERALLLVHSNVLLYNQLLQSLSLVLPLPGETSRTFLDWQKDEPELVARLRALVQERGQRLSEFTPAEQAEVALGYTLQKLRESGSRNMMLRLIPSVWAGDAGEWLSPWQLVLEGRSAPESAAYLGLWQKMAEAYRAEDATAWQQAVTEAAAAYPEYRTRMKAEWFYSRAELYALAVALYLLAAVFAARRWGVFLLGAGALIHAGAIGIRMYILARPPVGTLYESVLFVALVVAALALFMRAGAARAVAALVAAGLLIIAPFIEPDNETLGMLSAVLNTNFWLGVHVLTITVGYGLCLVTAAVAHLVLWREGRFERLLQLFAIGSLLFVTTGTFLGGVWADQSWGRFWGWDPKENGALLIMLWLIWLMHGKLGGQIGPRGYAAGMATLSIIVALAWFGVNLLGVGLHSYGFITGIAAGLLAFVVGQGALIIALYLRARRHAA